MKTYLINYYLHEACGCGGENHDHDHVHEMRDDKEILGELKELGQWGEIMPDCYIVKTEKSATEIATKIRAVMQAQDRIFVTEVNKDNADSSTAGVMDWIRQ